MRTLRSRCDNIMLTRRGHQVRQWIMRTAEVVERTPKKNQDKRRLSMKRNILFALVAMALGGAGVAQAQDYSGSWYIAPRIGYIEPDSKRTTDGNLYSGIGVGVWVNPNFAVDFEYAINNMPISRAARRATATSGKACNSALPAAGSSATSVRGGVRTSWAASVHVRHKAYSGFILHRTVTPRAAAGIRWPPPASVSSMRCPTVWRSAAKSRRVTTTTTTR